MAVRSGSEKTLVADTLEISTRSSTGSVHSPGGASPPPERDRAGEAAWRPPSCPQRLAYATADVRDGYTAPLPSRRPDELTCSATITPTSASAQRRTASESA